MAYKILSRNLLLVIALLCTGAVFAESVYQEPAEFIQEVYAENAPAPTRIWIKGELKDLARDILGHELNVLRLSYWCKAGRTTWILNETGKERPITVGIVVAEGAIEKIKVLVFRESRGWEVRYPFFTDQFIGVTTLNKEHKLDRKIDGISGATLSVNALVKVARLALVLHQHSGCAQDKTGE